MFYLSTSDCLKIWKNCFFTVLIPPNSLYIQRQVGKYSAQLESMFTGSSYIQDFYFASTNSTINSCKTTVPGEQSGGQWCTFGLTVRLKNGFNSPLFIRCDQLRQEWGGLNPLGPAASIYVSLLRTLLKLGSIPHAGRDEAVSRRRLLRSPGKKRAEARRWWNVAAWDADSRHNDTMCPINLKLYYAREKVYIACSHGDSTIAALPRVEIRLFSQ